MLPTPLLLLLFALVAIGCADKDAVIIKVDSKGIYVDNRKIANVDALENALEVQKDTSTKVLIQIDQEQSYSVLYNIVKACDYFGYADIKVNSEPIFLQSRLEPEDASTISLSVHINKDYLEIWARKKKAFIIFHKENSDSSYGELANKLIMIRERFIDSPDINLMRIYAEGDVKISDIIPVMRTIRTLGFSRTILEPAKEPIIMTIGDINEMFRILRAAADTSTLLIRIDSNAIFVNDNSIANAGKLKHVLKNALAGIHKKCHIQIYSGYKISTLRDIVVQACGWHSSTDISENISLIPDYYIKDSVLKIAIYEDGFDILSYGKLLPRISDSTYDELSKNLAKINNGFKDSLNSDSVFIYADGNIEISKLIYAMRKIRASGFTNIYLARGDPRFMKDFSSDLKAMRSQDEIMSVLNANMHNFVNIYNNHLKAKHGFGGKVMLKFTIAPSGEILSISIMSSTTNFPKFDEAIKNAVAECKFKSSENYSETTTTIPFNFDE